MTTLRRFTLRHGALLVILVGAALLLGVNVAMPVELRFPGFFVLLLIAAWLAFATPRRPT